MHKYKTKQESFWAVAVMNPDLVLVDSGFIYHRDPMFIQGDLTWFLMEKRS